MWAFIGQGLAIGVGAGLVIAVIIIVPTAIYILPYITWLGWNQGTKGIPRKQPSSQLPAGQYFKHQVKNASKLYRSWINHEPHNITDW